MKKIKHDEWSNKYREASADSLARFLVDRYIPTTKANQISKAIRDLHTAFCQIDPPRLEYIADNLPDLFYTACLYTDIHGEPNKDLREVLFEHRKEKIK